MKQETLYHPHYVRFTGCGLESSTHTRSHTEKTLYTCNQWRGGEWHLTPAISVERVWRNNLQLMSWARWHNTSAILMNLLYRSGATQYYRCQMFAMLLMMYLVSEFGVWHTSRETDTYRKRTKGYARANYRRVCFSLSCSVPLSPIYFIAPVNFMRLKERLQIKRVVARNWDPTKKENGVRRRRKRWRVVGK